MGTFIDIDIPGRNTGDTGHLADHVAIVEALGQLDTALTDFDGGPGAAQLVERGPYLSGTVYSLGDVFTWQSGRYAVAADFTGDTDPDLTKTISLGIDPAAKVELAVDGTKFVLGQQASGEALAMPTTARGVLPNVTDGAIVVETEDGTPITFLVVNGVVGAGGTAVDPPGAPTALSGTGGSGQVDLAWTAPADPGDSAITTYVVQYRRTGITSWTTFAHSASTATSITVTGLTGGQEYEFRVAAVNSPGNTGPWSDTATGTPTPPGVLFSEDYTTFDDGPLDTPGWSFSDPFAAPFVESHVLKGGGSGGSVNTQRTVTGSHNSVMRWHVPGGHSFTGLARYNGTTHFVAVVDSVKLTIGEAGQPDILIDTPTLAVPTTDYEVVLVMDGANLSLFVNDQAGPSTTSAPFADSSHDIVGFNLTGSTRQLLKFTVEELP